jgi:glycosyltransferase involved in cell wall biosynthesis
MIKISANLVVRNEEKLIRKCLESIKDIVDEIIVIHDGECQDSTLEICREYTDKIFIRDFIGVAEPHRPFGYEQTTGEWILQIDADEFLSDGLRKKIGELSLNNDIVAYEFLWKLWDGKKYITKNWPHKRCLFRKSALSYLGIPNFIAEINGKTVISDLHLEHQPEYNNYTFETVKNKWEKWAKLQAEIYRKDFSSINKFNYHEDRWPKKIQFRRNHPLFLIPVEFVVTVGKNLISGGYKEGLIGFKVALMIGVYRILVNYYLIKK